MNTDMIMSQAQVFASAWSIVGGRFDGGDAMDLAMQEKDELQRMVAELVAERDGLILKLSEVEKQEPVGYMSDEGFASLIKKEAGAPPIWPHKSERNSHPLFAHHVISEPVNSRMLEALRFYAEGHHFIQHDPTAWDTVSGEPQNFLEDEANTATVEDGSLAKAAIASAGEFRVRFDLQTALTGVSEFFDGEFHRIKGIVSSEQARGQRQEDECQPEFDHCLVDQGGGGLSGDDFHGTVFFHLGAGQYLTAEY